MKSGHCPKCGSAKIMKDAGVLDHANKNVKVRVQAQPDARVFKKGSDTEVRAWICGSCGYAEFYAVEPQELLRKHKSKRR